MPRQVTVRSTAGHTSRTERDPDVASAATRCHRRRTSLLCCHDPSWTFYMFFVSDADNFCSKFLSVVTQFPVDSLVASPWNQSISHYLGNARRLQRECRDGSLSRGRNSLTLHGWSTTGEEKEAAAGESCAHRTLLCLSCVPRS